MRVAIASCTAVPPQFTDDQLIAGALTERGVPLYARVDMIRDRAGTPTLLELEAIEPNFYLDQVPATTAIVADAIVSRLPGG